MNFTNESLSRASKILALECRTEDFLSSHGIEKLNTYSMTYEQEAGGHWCSPKEDYVIIKVTGQFGYTRCFKVSCDLVSKALVLGFLE